VTPIADLTRTANSPWVRSWMLGTRKLSDPQLSFVHLQHEYLDERDLPFIRENVATAYKALSRTGTLQVDPDTPRSLTDHNRRAIALQAAAGDVEGAVGRCLQLRMPEQASEMWQYSPSLQDALDAIAAPEYKRLVEEAVWFCWGHGRANLLTYSRPTTIHSRVHRWTNSDREVTRRSMECVPSGRERCAALGSIWSGHAASRTGTAHGLG